MGRQSDGCLSGVVWCTTACRTIGKIIYKQKITKHKLSTYSNTLRSYKKYINWSLKDITNGAISVFRKKITTLFDMQITNCRRVYSSCGTWPGHLRGWRHRGEWSIVLVSSVVVLCGGGGGRVGWTAGCGNSRQKMCVSTAKAIGVRATIYRVRRGRDLAHLERCECACFVVPIYYCWLLQIKAVFVLDAMFNKRGLIFELLNLGVVVLVAGL